MSISGIVFNIQRFSIHDGPGIRTTIFFKGCPLRCFWCHNPEGIRLKLEVQFFPSRCIVCAECLKACEHTAHEIKDGIHIYHREKCSICGACIETCYAGTMELIGKSMTVEQVVDEVIRDRPFYETSNGGVTLSGGEPLLQLEFARSILECCKNEGIHTAIETIANCKWEDFESLLPITDLIMMDIKHLDPDKHKEVTGASNKTILENAKRIAQIDKPVIFRIPIVPSVNDTPEEINVIADFIVELIELRKKSFSQKNNIDIQLEFLPFHQLATDKYRSLGFVYQAGGLETSTKQQITDFKNIARNKGIHIVN